MSVENPTEREVLFLLVPSLVRALEEHGTLTTVLYATGMSHKELGERLHKLVDDPEIALLTNDDFINLSKTVLSLLLIDVENAYADDK